MKIYIDGTLYEEADAKISVLDHGLLYGDGVFEGIRIYCGRVFRLEEHIDRLFDSARAILLKIPMDKEALIRATLDTCRANQLQDGYIRLLVTRGVGSLGLNPESCKVASVIIIADRIQLYPEEFYQKGLKIITAATQRMPPNALSPAVKSLNYLNNILAKIEGRNAGVQEVLMLNGEGQVAECSGDNVFVVKRGRIFTPPIYAGALGGITRLCIMEICAELGRPVTEVPLTRYDLHVADEVFLTGTGAEVVPVVDIDARIIGDGIPGAFTRQVIGKFRDLTRSTGTPI
jgi:branched-chain amino acid aminotransferase